MSKKKSIRALVLLSAFLAVAASFQIDLLAQTQTTEQEFIPFDQTVIKTYKLRYIKPTELIQATRVYLLDSSYADDMISVRIRKGDLSAFEDILKKLDVEKKDILFKIYPITAFREEGKENSPIQDVNLKNALQELGNLWNFKSYSVDKPSFVTIREGSGPEVFRLVSFYNLNMEITNVRVRDETAGDRTISIETMKLWGTMNFVETNFLETYNRTMKEKGFLVAGISGFGADKALILVINAEVKEKSEY